MIELPASKHGLDIDMTQKPVYIGRDFFETEPVTWQVETTDMFPEEYMIVNGTRVRRRRYVEVKPTEFLGSDYNGPMIDFFYEGELLGLRVSEELRNRVQMELDRDYLSSTSYRKLVDIVDRREAIEERKRMVV